MILGEIRCVPGFGCVRCGQHHEANILTTVIHDLRCWGLGTALHNAWTRLTEPDWFVGEWEPDLPGTGGLDGQTQRES